MAGVNRRDLLAMATALLVVVVPVAGCSAVDRSGGGADDPASALTPAPVPPDGPTRASAPATATVLAPGLSVDGVYDPGRLAAAHARALAGQSYTVRIVSVRRHGNGSLVTRFDRTIAFADDTGRFHYVLTERRPGERRHVERWGDGDRVYEFVRDGNATSRSVLTTNGVPRDPTRQFPDRATNRVGIRQAFGIANLTVTDRRVRDGTTSYRVAVVGGETTITPLREFSLVAWVTANGLVTEYHVDYSVVHDGATIDVTVDVAYRRVGATTVERPAWVDDVDDRSAGRLLD